MKHDEKLVDCLVWLVGLSLVVGVLEGLRYFAKVLFT